MAYSYETSSVKTLNGEVSGLADVIARQALSAQMSLSAGEGINFVEDAENNRTRIDLGLSAGTNMSFVYDQETNKIRIDCEAEGAINAFPMTGTNGTTNYTANCDCSSFYFTTAQSPAGANTTMTVRGVHYQAYPATDVSASWYNIITQQSKITCSAVKLSTASNTETFYTSAVPNLSKITFIAPSYGPYETYSALIDDGDTVFNAEVDSGCCRTVVRCWNDDRNKDCWCGLNQESYFYIG